VGEVEQEISIAIETLRLSDNQINKLDYEKGKKIYYEFLDFFIKSGDRRWWWEDFNEDSFDFIYYEKPFEHLIDIIPDLTENVWLMVEDEHEDYYPIYDCNPSIIGQIIGECFGFEYYVIDKNKEWLICENHHHRLIGLGQILKEKNKDKIKLSTKA
jgi:hypothetical protein